MPPSKKPLWELSSTGRPPKYETPEELQKDCIRYFQWAQGNPLIEEKLFNNNGTIVVGKAKRVRAFTLMGLQLFLSVSHGQWSRWRSHERPDLQPVIEWAEQCIYEQKFTAAAANMLNANIISRELGLADRSELSGPGGGPIQTEEVSPRERIKNKLAGLSSRQSGSEDEDEDEDDDGE